MQHRPHRPARAVASAATRAEFLLVTVFFVLSAWLVLAIRRSLFGRRLVAVNDSPAAYATVGLNIGFTKVAVFAIAAGMAGLAGALYGTVQEVVGTTDFDIFPGIIFVLFVTIWSIRTVSGAFLAAAHLRGRSTSSGPAASGIFAGIGHHPDRPGRQRHPRHRGAPVPAAVGQPRRVTPARAEPTARVGSGARRGGIPCRRLRATSGGHGRPDRRGGGRPLRRRGRPERRQPDRPSRAR